MKYQTQLKNYHYPGLLLYRVGKYPKAAILSFLITILLAGALYYFINRVYPDFNPIGEWLRHVLKLSDADYTFYSGPQGGTYNTIGKFVEGRFDGDDDVIHNKESSGSSENAMKIRVEGSAFGIVQEEDVRKDEDIKNHIKLITPLFLERMHIFYKKGLFSEVGNDSLIQLSGNMDSSLLYDFAHKVKNINAGPIGSGTRILASYLLNEIEEQIKTKLKTYPAYHLTDESVKAIQNNIIGKKKNLPDIIFYVGADPNIVVSEILSLGKYSLMSVNPSFIPDLNKRFNLNLRIADFTRKYEGIPQVSTFGTMAYLIASGSVADHDVVQILKKIDNCKGKIDSALFPLPGAATNDPRYTSDTDKYLLYPLVEFGFFKSFAADYNALQKNQLRDVMIFIVTLATIFFQVLKWLNGLSSTLKKWKFNKNIDETTMLIEKPGNPADMNYCRGVLNDLRKEIINLYSDGSLTQKDYEPLLKRIDYYFDKTNEQKPEVKVKIIKSKSGRSA